MFYYNVNEYNNLLIILIRHNTIRNIMVTYKKNLLIIKWNKRVEISIKLN